MPIYRKIKAALKEMEQSMYSGGSGFRGRCRFAGPVCMAMMTLGLAILTLAAYAENGVLRSRVYKFRHIEAKQGIDLLEKLNLCKVDRHSSSVIVITGDVPANLIKASSVLQMLDRTEKVEFKVLMEPSVRQGLPAVSQLLALLKDQPVGTLLDPPAIGTKNAGVVDMLNDKIIAIAATETMPEIERALSAWEKTQNTQTPPASESSQPAAAEPNQPAIKQPKIAAAEPNRPGAPQPAEPNRPETAKKTVIDIQSTEPNVLTIKPQAHTAAGTEQKDIVGPVLSEPNKPTQPDEDFFGDELLKTLAAAEQKTQKTQSQEQLVREETKPVVETGQPREPNAMAAGPQIAEQQAITAKPAEDEDVRFKQIVDALMKQDAQQQTAVTETEQRTEQQMVSEKLSEQPAKPAIAEKTVQIPQQPAVRQEAEKIQKTPAEPTMAQGEKELELTITLPEKVDVVALLELVGKQLGLNYIYDPAKIRGDVMLKIHDGKIKVKDTYALLESVLKFRGFAMTRRGNLVTIMPLAEAAQYDPALRRPQEPMQPGDVVVSSVFELQYANINNVQNILRQMNLGTIFIPIIETNTLIVTDYAYRMDRITEIIGMMDVPGEPKEFVFRQLKYMQASEILPKIQQLAAQLENVSVSIGSGTQPQQAPTRIDPRATRRAPQAAPVNPSQPASAEGRQTVFLDPDDRTNRLFMIGFAEQIRIVNELIDSLDVPQYDLRYVKEYPVKNVDATEIISVLNELGLAKVPVSTPASTTTQFPVPARAGRTPPSQPMPTQMPSATTTSGGIDQPYVSIRTNTNSLLVNATEEQHNAIGLVISYVDVEQKDKRVINEYEIQNVDAGQIVRTLSGLGIISQQTASSAMGTTASGSSAMGTAASPYSAARRDPDSSGRQQPGMASEESPAVFLPTAEGGAVTDLTASEPQIAVLETTNSLLVFATPRQHAAIALVIAHVDRQLDRITTPYVVYPLENQKPEDLAKVLNDLIKETVPDQAGPSSPEAKIQTRPRATETAASPSREEEKIRIIPDESSYSLIVFANKKNQQWIGELIKQLDQYRPQVLLDCTLVSITKDDEFKFDLDMISRKGGLGASLTQLTNPITGGTSKSITAANGTALEGTVSFGAGSAFYGDDNIQALLNLTDKKGYGRVLGRPSILVKDNEQGVIKAENVKYIATYSSSTLAPDQGSAQISTNVNFKDYPTGITLTITPHIASEKLMQLEIELDRKDIDPSDTSGGTASVKGDDYPKPLDTVSSNIKTWSIIPSGATIILGGIETINQTKGVDKMPILGDLPLVGLLFRGTSQTDLQSKLYIFVKANIIKAGDELTGQSDIERISRKKRMAFEEDEAQFQGMRAVPGIKPNPIHPGKILEDDEYIQKLKEQQAQGNVVAVPTN